MPQTSDDTTHVEFAVGSKRHFQQHFAFEIQFARLFRVHRFRLIENFDLSGQGGGIIQRVVASVCRHLLRREPGNLHSLAIGAPISVARAIFWNLLPVTLGNVVAGTLFTGVALYATYAAKPALLVSSAQLPVETPADTVNAPSCVPVSIVVQDGTPVATNGTTQVWPWRP